MSDNEYTYENPAYDGDYSYHPDPTHGGRDYSQSHNYDREEDRYNEYQPEPNRRQYEDEEPSRRHFPEERYVHNRQTSEQGFFPRSHRVHPESRVTNIPNNDFQDRGRYGNDYVPRGEHTSSPNVEENSQYEEVKGYREDNNRSYQNDRSQGKNDLRRETADASEDGRRRWSKPMNLSQNAFPFQENRPRHWLHDNDSCNSYHTEDYEDASSYYSDSSENGNERRRQMPRRPVRKQQGPHYNKDAEYMHITELISGQDERNKFHEINLDTNVDGNRRRRLKEAVMTMRNAQKVAKQLGLMTRDRESVYDDESEEDEGSQISELPFKNTQRKCWAKACWSRSKHSHVLHARDARNRAKLLQSPESATSFSVWDQQQQKAKKRLKDLWQELVPLLYIWKNPMKVIEGQYGMGVVSYFVFLRWLLYLNLAIFLMVFLLIVLPQVVHNAAVPKLSSFPVTSTETTPAVSMTTSQMTNFFLYAQWLADPVNGSSVPLECSKFNSTDSRMDLCKCLYLEGVKNKTQTGIENLLDLLQGTGFMENTALFPGWYSTVVRNFLLPGYKEYNLALAYILVTVVYFLLCLMMMVVYTTDSVRESFKTADEHLHKYSNLVFGGWDFCIEEGDPANRKHQSIAQELKSNLAQERRHHEIANWSRQKLLKVYAGRVLANFLVICILAGTLYCIFVVCKLSLESENVDKANFTGLLIQFSPSLAVTAFNILLPIIFSQIVRLENYAVDFEIKLTLVRTVFIRLASVVFLIATFYIQIECKEADRDPDCKYCTKLKLRCWENYVGQQIYKLVILDSVVVVVSVFLMDFPRKLIVKHCQCKLSKIIGYQEFDIPKNVLDLVYSQTLCWLGTFYSPLLPGISLLKFIIFFYVKKLTLLTNYVPSKVPYRASRSNTFFVMVLMLSFILSAVPVGFGIAEFSPSLGCSPFRGHNNMWNVVSTAVRTSDSKVLNDVLSFLVTPGFGVPVFVALCLAIYFYSTLSAANRQMVSVLKEQLVLEGKDKSFLLARLTEVTKLHRLPNK